MIRVKETQPRSLRSSPVMSAVLSNSPTSGLVEIDTTHHSAEPCCYFSLFLLVHLDASSEYRMIAPAPDPYTPVAHSSYPTCRVLDRVLSSSFISSQEPQGGFIHKIVLLNRFAFCRCRLLSVYLWRTVNVLVH